MKVNFNFRAADRVTFILFCGGAGSKFGHLAFKVNDEDVEGSAVRTEERELIKEGVKRKCTWSEGFLVSDKEAA